MSCRATVQCFMKCVMWILYGKYCIAICGLPVNAWCNLWIHTRVIVMHTGVHAMMTLKCLRMRHAYNSDMQTNICNAICMVLCAWRCNDVFFTVFHFSEADVDSTCWVYLLLDLYFLQTSFFFEVNSNAMIVQKFIKLSKFFNHSWDSVHSINLTNFDFPDYHLFSIRKGQKYH